jgi:hypothetical protein
MSSCQSNVGIDRREDRGEVLGGRSGTEAPHANVSDVVLNDRRQVFTGRKEINMTRTVEEQWQDLCAEFDEAQDAVTEAMSNRDAGTYQSGKFWKRLEEAQDR